MSVMLIAAWTVAVCVVAICVTLCGCVLMAVRKQNRVPLPSSEAAMVYAGAVSLNEAREIRNVASESFEISKRDQERIRKDWLDRCAGPSKQ